jgi:hypothetical protein
MDEAWQLLHHMRALPNPLAPKSGLVAYLWASRRTYIQRSCEIARIQGVSLFPDQPKIIKWQVVTIWILALAMFAVSVPITILELSIYSVITLLKEGILLLTVVATAVWALGRSIYSVLLAPVRWLARQGQAVGRTMSNDLGTYVARRRSWSLLQEIAFGLEGYGFQLPKVEMAPTFAPSAIYKFEELPERVLQRALAKREEWVRQNFGEVTKTFSELVVSASDLSSLLKKVETDLSLVHAAYYTDDECIERIADWITGTQQTVEVETAVRLAS